MNNGRSKFKSWIIGLRNDFHKHPELSTLEERTTQQIIKVLKRLDIHTEEFDDFTGVTGLLQGRRQGPEKSRTIALRADIDALPVQELTHRENQSVNPGVMHACGHDANTAIVLGVARKIKDSDLLDQINGSIKLIFQPAEEKLGGARAMIKRGVLDNPPVDRIIAGHMDPNLPVGKVGVFTRIGHAASDSFELVIKGTGTHGARPHQGVNPITAAGAFATALDSIISRNISPAQSAVISVGTCHSGDAGNVIPEQAVMTGTIRTHDMDVRAGIFKSMENLVQGIDKMTGTDSKLIIKPGAPLGVNDTEVCKALYAASTAVLGEKNVKILPFIMGGEDFYYFTQKCPGAIMRFGCASKKDGITYPLHSPYFDIHEDVLEIGAAVLFKAVKDFFNQ